MHLALACDAMAVRTALQNLRDGLNELHLSQDDTDRIEIVMAEILNNIVEHACSDRPDCNIGIEILHKSSDLQVTVTDNGCAMPGGTLPEGILADIQGSRDSLPEGGFGWFLIRDLTTNVSYSRRDQKNHLSFEFELGRDSVTD